MMHLQHSLYIPYTEQGGSHLSYHVENKSIEINRNTTQEPIENLRVPVRTCRTNSGFFQMKLELIFSRLLSMRLSVNTMATMTKSLANTLPSVNSFWVSALSSLNSTCLCW